MSEPHFVDVTYRGLAVARKARLTPDERGQGGFVELETPLPVGTAVSVLEEGREPRAARVVGVVEHEASAKGPPGMRLAWGEAAPVAAAAAAEPEPEASSAEASSADTTGDEAGNGQGKKKRKKRR